MANGASEGLVAIGKSHPVAFGFLGAYFFSIQFLLRRYLARDLNPRAYMHLVVRVMIVVLLTLVYATIRVADPDVFIRNERWPVDVIVVSFGGGVTPNITWDRLRGLAYRALGRTGGDESNELSLNNIQGLNIWQRARLFEEGIQDAQNLAMADILDLMVTTRLGVVRLLDWIDQALPYVHVGADINLYRHQGIRTASAFVLSFFGPDDQWKGDWNNPIPGTPVFRTGSGGGAEAKIVSLAIAITNHPNFLRVQQLRDAAREAARHRLDVKGREENVSN